MNESLKQQIKERGLLALKLSMKSAEIAMGFIGDARQWDKKDSSPVTEADLAIDRQLQKGISAAYPQDAILSEEAADDRSRLDNDLCWVIDPIDGTKEFIRQSKDFCVMIGICYKGEPVFGVINIPKTGEVFYGGEEFGISLKRHGEVINLPNVPLQDDKVLCSRSQRGQIILPYMTENGLTPLPCGSSGVKACRLIDGTASTYIHGTSIREWDTAAADALVRAVGGYFRGMDGEELTYNKPKPTIDGIIATHDWQRVKDVRNFFAGRLTFD